MLKLYDFQEHAINETRKSFAKGNKKVILSLPTGAGKTVIALHIVKGALDKGKRVAFVVDRLTLLDQTANFMYQQGLDFGVIQGQNQMTNFSKRFQICSAQTLAKRNKEFDFVIIDEAHVVFKHHKEMLGNPNGTYFLGLTATPFTKGLGKLWDDLICTKRTGELIEEGFLSKYVVYGPSQPDLTGVRVSAGDYNKKDLANKTDTSKLVGDIIEHWFRLASDRRTVVMAVNVAHAEHIAEEFKSKGIAADVVHTYLPDKENEVKKRLNAFREGKTQLLASVDMISRGFDMPQADCLIMARPTRSLNFHLQALGRILRIFPGKEYALILDHAGNIERMGFPCDEFPMFLDMGEKKKSGGKKGEPMPKPCPQCFFMKPPKTRTCPKCGFETKKVAGVEIEEGTLEEIQKDRRTRAKTENKDRLYAKLMAGAQVAGFKNGWAAHQYREYYGVWPAKNVEMDMSFYDFLCSLPRNRVMKIVWSLNGKSKKDRQRKQKLITEKV